MKIVAQTLVRNEERWIWFALMAIIDDVDEIMVWDTGSTDQTVEIIKSINNPKIKFKQVPTPTEPEQHSEYRRQMLAETDADWLVTVDGDEIWWQRDFKKAVDHARHNPNLAGIITPYINVVGDMFHSQDPKSSHYKIGKYYGPYTIRFINRNLPSLQLVNPHGRQEYQTQGQAIQNLPDDKLTYLDGKFLHTTHLPRSVNRSNDLATLKRGFKYRYELGYTFPTDFVYPEVFYYPRPEIVPDPFFHSGFKYTLIAALLHPLRVLKNTFWPFRKSGY